MEPPQANRIEPIDLTSFVRQDRATVVLEFPELRTLSRMEPLIKAQLQKPGLFPTVSARAKTPQGEGLVFSSESNACQLVILPTTAQLQVGFYGNFEVAGGLPNCIAYLDTKIRSVMSLVREHLRQPIRTLAVIFDFKLSSHGLPVDDILSGGPGLLPLVHPALDMPVFDYQAKVAYEVESTFFVNVSVAVYETMTASVSPSTAAQAELVRVHPHQLRRADRGLQFVLDANTRLLSRHKLPDLTSEHWVKMITFVTDFRQTTIRRILQRLHRGEP